MDATLQKWSGTWQQDFCLPPLPLQKCDHVVLFIFSLQIHWSCLNFLKSTERIVWQSHTEKQRWHGTVLEFDSNPLFTLEWWQLSLRNSIKANIQLSGRSHNCGYSLPISHGMLLWRWRWDSSPLAWLLGLPPLWYHLPGFSMLYLCMWACRFVWVSSQLLGLRERSNEGQES